MNKIAIEALTEVKERVQKMRDVGEVDLRSVKSFIESKIKELETETPGSMQPAHPVS